MSKTPVTYEYRFSRIEGANGDISVYDVSDNVGYEIAKRINMHNELVCCLMLARDMFIANDLILPKTLETINDCLEKCK